MVLVNTNYNISAIVREQCNMTLLSVQPFNVALGLEGSSPALRDVI